MLRWTSSNTLTITGSYFDQDQFVGGGFHINSDLDGL